MLRRDRLLLLFIFLFSLCISALLILLQLSNTIIEAVYGSGFLSGILICIGWWKLGKTWRKQMVAPLLLLVFSVLFSPNVFYLHPPVEYTGDLPSVSTVVIGALGIYFSIAFLILSFRFFWKSRTLPKQNDSGKELFVRLFWNTYFKGALLTDIVQETSPPDL